MDLRAARLDDEAALATGRSPAVAGALPHPAAVPEIKWCVPVRLLHVHDRGGAGADDGGLGVAAQGGLQDAGELGVAVGDVPACASRKGRWGIESRVTIDNMTLNNEMQ